MQHAPCGTRIVIPEFDAIIASDPYLTCEPRSLEAGALTKQLAESIARYAGSPTTLVACGFGALLTAKLVAEGLVPTVERLVLVAPVLCNWFDELPAAVSLCPVLVVYGDRDAVFLEDVAGEPATLLMYFPNARLAAIPGCNHLAWCLPSPEDVRDAPLGGELTRQDVRRQLGEILASFMGWTTRATLAPHGPVGVRASVVNATPRRPVFLL